MAPRAPRQRSSTAGPSRYRVLRGILIRPADGDRKRSVAVTAGEVLPATRLNESETERLLRLGRIEPVD